MESKEKQELIGTIKALEELLERSQEENAALQERLEKTMLIVDGQIEIICAIGNKKPPAEVLPKVLHDEQRIIELLDGMRRYAEAGFLNNENRYQSMREWHAEMGEILERYAE